MPQGTLPFIVGTTVNSVILALVYLFFYLSQRRRHLGLWALAWGIYAARFAAALANAQLGGHWLPLAANQILPLWSGLFLLLGAQDFTGRRLQRWLAWPTLLGSAWVLAAAARGMSILAMSLPGFLFLGVVDIYAGVVFLGSRPLPRLGRSVVGWALVLWGLHKFDYPFLVTNPQAAPWGFALGSFLALVSAVGIVILIYEQNNHELQEGRERFRQVVENIQEVFWVCSPDWRTVHYISPAYEKIWGRPVEELYQRHNAWMDAVDPKDKSVVREGIEAIGRDPAPEQAGWVRFRINTPDGLERHIEARGFRVRDEKGQVVRIAGVAVDVTEGHRAQEALRASESKYRLLFEANQDSIIIAEADGGRIVECNHACGALMGCPAPELIGMDMAGLFVAEHRPPADLRQWVRETDGRIVEARMDTGGGPRPVEMRTALLALDGRDLVLAVARDVSEKVWAARSLHRSREHLRAVYEAADSVGLITCRSDGEARVMEWSPGAEKIFGHGRDDMAGVPVNLLAASGLMPPGAGPLEMTLIRKGGKPFPAMVTRHPLLDEAGRAAAELVVVVDLSERQKVEQEKARLEQRLAQAQKMEAIGTLAGGIAHDFNNILAAIIGYAELASDKGETLESPEPELRAILASAARASTLVRKMLAFSRSSQANPQPLDLNRTVERALREFAQARPFRVEMRLNLAPDLPRVSADAPQIEQVLWALAENAVDAMGDGGMLSVGTRAVTAPEDRAARQWGLAPGRYAAVSVGDTGPGIDQATMQKIFEPFFTTKEVGRGTGLGLSTVFGIVQSHGGSVHCNSAPGQGAEFWVVLPARRDGTNPKKAEAPAPAAAERGRGTALLVDDEPGLLEIGSRLLQKAGFRVVTADSGEQALELYDRDPGGYSLVILDIIMPGMGGAAALERLLRRSPKPRVLLVSGYAPGGDPSYWLRRGAAGYLPKPYGAEGLLRAVEQTLGGDAAAKESG